jgi:predicted transcriptional regulator
MRTVVAHVSELEQPVVGQLVLKVEGPVLGVRQFVVDVIAAEQEGAKEVALRPASRITAGGLRKVG